MTHAEQITGAAEMARHWVRNPGRMTDAGFEQVCRELYTISVALDALEAEHAALKDALEVSKHPGWDDTA